METKNDWTQEVNDYVNREEDPITLAKASFNLFQATLTLVLVLGGAGLAMAIAIIPVLLVLRWIF